MPSSYPPLGGLCPYWHDARLHMETGLPVLTNLVQYIKYCCTCSTLYIFPRQNNKIARKIRIDHHQCQRKQHSSWKNVLLIKHFCSNPSFSLHLWTPDKVRHQKQDRNLRSVFCIKWTHTYSIFSKDWGWVQTHFPSKMNCSMLSLPYCLWKWYFTDILQTYNSI